VSGFTLLGSSGFIGSHVLAELHRRGADVWTPGRDESLRGRPLGCVLYCVGLTADFRERTFDTVQAHVGHLQDVLQHAQFESLLYLSSTRVYAGTDSTDEDACLRVCPTRVDSLYNISKLMGESLCLSCGRSAVRVARLSNVYGVNDTSSNFLTAVVSEALTTGEVVLQTSLDSAKDYVDVRRIAELLPRIARDGRRRVYNVASGENTTHAEIIGAIRRIIPCVVNVPPDAPTVTYPVISTTRIREEFAWAPCRVLDDIEHLVNDRREAMRQ